MVISMKYYYCPICGIVKPEYQTHCEKCGADVSTSESQFEQEYYDVEAEKVYGDKRMRLQILLNREVRPNPLYSSEINKMVWDKFFEKCGSVEPSQPLLVAPNQAPSCPNCGSNNTKKLSFLNRYLHYRAIGFLSKTARSQWCCQSCGHKW